MKKEIIYSLFTNGETLDTFGGQGDAGVYPVTDSYGVNVLLQMGLNSVRGLMVRVKKTSLNYTWIKIQN